MNVKPHSRSSRIMALAVALSATLGVASAGAPARAETPQYRQSNPDNRVETLDLLSAQGLIERQGVGDRVVGAVRAPQDSIGSVTWGGANGWGSGATLTNLVNEYGLWWWGGTVTTDNSLRLIGHLSYLNANDKVYNYAGAPYFTPRNGNTPAYFDLPAGNGIGSFLMGAVPTDVSGSDFATWVNIPSSGWQTGHFLVTVVHAQVGGDTYNVRWDQNGTRLCPTVYRNMSVLLRDCVNPVTVPAGSQPVVMIRRLPNSNQFNFYTVNGDASLNYHSSYTVPGTISSLTPSIHAANYTGVDMPPIQLVASAWLPSSGWPDWFGKRYHLPQTGAWQVTHDTGAVWPVWSQGQLTYATSSRNQGGTIATQLRFGDGTNWSPWCSVTSGANVGTTCASSLSERQESAKL